MATKTYQGTKEPVLRIKSKQPYQGTKALEVGGAPTAFALKGGATDARQNKIGTISSERGQRIIEKDVQPVVDGANQNFALAEEGRIKAKEKAKNEENTLDDAIATELDESKTPEQKALALKVKSIERERDIIENAYNSMTLAASRAAGAQVSALKSQLRERQRVLGASNNSELAAHKQALLRMGGPQYAPTTTAGFVSAVEREGIRRAGELDNRYNSEIAAINAALESKEYDIAAQKAQSLTKIEKEMQSLLDENLKEMEKNNRVMQYSDDIYSEFEAGNTDPALVYFNLRKNGVNVTPDEVSEVLSLWSTTGDAEDVKNDFDEFQYFKKSGMLPASISGLPETEQYFAWLNTQKLANAGKLGGVVGSMSAGGGEDGDVFVGPGANDGTDEKIIRMRLFSKLMNVLNKGTLSETDREVINQSISELRGAGLTEQQIMSRLAGLPTDVDSPYNGAFIDIIAANTEDLDKQGQLVAKVGQLLGAGNYRTAMETIERRAMDNARLNDPDNYLGQATAKTLLDRTARIKALLKKGGVVGPVEGSFQKVLNRVQGEEAAKIRSELSNLYAEFRKQNAGTSVTANELKFLNPLFADISDREGNFLIKLNTFENSVLDKYNSARDSVSLPLATAEQARNADERLKLYEGASEQDFWGGASPIFNETEGYVIPE